MAMTVEMDFSGNGAVYHRVSTDVQDAERQRRSTSDCLGRHSAEVRPEYVYEDEGWSRADADRRPAFQRLLREVVGGTVKWILVDRPDRFGAKDKFQAFHFLYLLRESGCRLYTVDGRELTAGDTAAALMTHLDYDQSERELREKSLRTLEGKRLLAKRGEWQGGRIPYGMDVVAFRLDGQGNLTEQWRVQMVRHDLRIKVSPAGLKEYHGRRNFPASEADEVLQLRPTTDVRRLDVIRWVFQKYDGEATNPGALARHLADQGTDLPPYANQWRQYHVADILKNPVYMGHPAWNRKSVGDYTEWTGGARREKNPGSRKRIHAQVDWIMPDEPLFEPIVAPELWQRVQVKLEANKKGPRRSRPQDYHYSGLVICGNCGSRMAGSPMSSGRKQKRRIITYVCGKANNWRAAPEKCPCKRFRVEQSLLDEYVRAYLDETGRHVGEIGESVELQAQPPEAFKLALQRASGAWSEMVTRLELDMRQYDANLLLGDRSEVNRQIEEMYRKAFRGDRAHLQHALDELETEHTQLSLAWKELPTPRAKEKARRRLEEIEEEMSDLERQVTNAADLWKEAVADCVRLAKAWRRAQDAVAEEGNGRRVAEAIKQVIARIIVKFKPTGRNYPVGVVDTIKIVPVDDLGGGGGNGKIGGDFSGPGTWSPARHSRSSS